MPSTASAVSENPADREIVLSRVFAAPRELVWQAWTEPQHVVNWWGPRGFSTTIKQMDFRVGGYWEHVMHGPDGVNYPNKSRFLEIVPLEKIVYAHGGGREDGPGASFTATWTFETVGPNQTKLTGRLVFPDARARDFVAKEFGAIEGGRQTLERLSEFLPTLQSKPFVLEREFDAPRDVVWRAWTDAEQLKRWFGPKGFGMPTCVMDLRPGGSFHYGLRSPEGMELWGKWVFREVIAPEKLVSIQSFADAQGNVATHPMNPSWPREILSIVKFTEREGKTFLRLEWFAYGPTEEQQKAFDAARESMTQGWGGTVDKLDDYLAKR